MMPRLYSERSVSRTEPAEREGTSVYGRPEWAAQVRRLRARREQRAADARRAARSSCRRKRSPLLCVLARQPGRLADKNALLDAVWGHRFVSESVLKSTISQVRAALGRRRRRAALHRDRRAPRLSIHRPVPAAAVRQRRMPRAAIAGATAQRWRSAPSVAARSGAQSALARLRRAGSRAGRRTSARLDRRRSRRSARPRLIDRFVAERRRRCRRSRPVRRAIRRRRTVSADARSAEGAVPPRSASSCR